MPEKQTIPANADVLAWARDESGYTLGDAAQRLGISTAELAAIERGELAPSIETFHRMSRVYKQIESVLLLPSPPETDPLPRDYRSGPASGRPRPETRTAIREARRIQHYVSDLLADDPTLMPRAEIPPATLSDDPETLASRERQRFGVTVADQRQWKPYRAAFKQWRAHAERMGMLVLVGQLSRT